MNGREQKETEKAEKVSTLTPKQSRFVEEYLVDLNATQAAIRAGYSEKTAKEQGTRLFTNVAISNEIRDRMAARSERTEITQDRVIRELACIAFVNPRNVFSWGPTGVTLKDSGEISEDDARAVSEVSETSTKDGGTIRAKLHDKVKALELLGKHLGMFSDNRAPKDTDWTAVGAAYTRAMEGNS